MSDTTPTPRTDEVAFLHGMNIDETYRDEIKPPAFWSAIEHAKTLERELSASRELCRKYKEVAEELRDYGMPETYKLENEWRAACSKLQELNQSREAK